MLASFIDTEAVAPASPIVERTIVQLRKEKPFSSNGPVPIQGLNVIKVSVAPDPIDCLDLPLTRIEAAVEALGIKLVPGEIFAIFQCECETIDFSISEAVRREKHAPPRPSSPNRRRPVSAFRAAGTFLAIGMTTTSAGRDGAAPNGIIIRPARSCSSWRIHT